MAGGGQTPAPGANPCRVESAVLRTVAYSDVFDFPLRLDEIHRYLAGTRATRGQVREAVERLVPRHLFFAEGLVGLAQRPELIAVRQRRESAARASWPRAVAYGRRIAGLPFVRMVAITGSLAVGNMASAGDADYLIVTEAGRVWLARALVIQLVRAARLRGAVLCPNFLLSESALSLQERNLYVARELTQMVPVAGVAIYREMRSANSWTDELLPNASGPPRPLDPAADSSTRLRSLAEAALRTRTGAVLERWEMNRKIRELSRSNDDEPEVKLSAERCQGHAQGHGRRILSAYAERLRELSIEPQA